MAKIRAFNERTLLALFQPGDKHSDQEAGRFLKEFANDQVEENTMSDQARFALMGTTNACKDPLSHVINGEDMMMHGRSSPAYSQLRRFLPAVLDGAYPVNRKARGCLMMRLAMDAQKKPGSEEFANKAFDLYLEVLTSDVYREDEMRIRWRDVLGFVANIPIVEQARFHDAAKNVKTAHPWLVDMIGGLHHIKAAWEARGEGWAMDVPEASWKVFNDHMQQAHSCLVRASTVRPDYPEAATYLIAVAMGGVIDQGRDERYWFDQAVRAEFDFLDAYKTMHQALLPKWGGSIEALRAFGLECFQTQRFDTRVPYRYYHALQAITEETDGDYAFWNQAETYGNLTKLFEETIARTKFDEWRNAYIAVQAAMNWKLARWDEAKRALASLKGAAPNAEMVREFDGFVTTVLEDIWAHTSASVAPRIRTAEQAHAERRFGEAASAYEAMLAEQPAPKPPPPPPETAQQRRAAAKRAAAGPSAQEHTQRFLRRRLLECRWLEAFDAGKWVDVTPSPELLNWQVIDGQWTSTGTIVTGLALSDGPHLLCTTDFGERYELQCDVKTFANVPDDIRHAALSYRFSFASNWVYQTLAAYVGKGKASARFRSTGKSGPEVTCAVGEGARLTVRSWDNDAIGLVNDQVAYAGGPLESRTEKPPFYFGLCSRNRVLEERVEFSNIRIRKLTARPQELSVLPDQQ